MEENNNKIGKGILYAFIGALVGTIPWILVYIFGNLIVAILSILIALGSYKGYKMSKAPVDKKLPFIVAITSVLSITLATFIIIPLALLAEEGFDVSIDNLIIIYNTEELVGALIGDYVISLLFTAFGISGIVSNLHKQIKNGATAENIEFNVSNQVAVVQPDELEATKNVFAKYDALNKYNTITKEEIISDLNSCIPEIRANEIFNLLRTQQVIRKYKGKYYFKENAKPANAGKVVAITIGVTVLVFVLLAVFVAMFSDDTDTNKNKVNKINKVEINMTEINNNLNQVSQNISKVTNSINNTVNSVNSVQSGINTNNTNSINNSSQKLENGYEISNTGMNFIAKDGLVVLTKEEIKENYGSEYLEYEIMAINMDEGRVMYCFIEDGSAYKELTSKEFMEKSLSSSDISEDISVVNIAGYEFQTARLKFERNGKTIIEDCYVCKINNKFVCFDYCYVEGTTSSFEEMIQKK